MTDDSAASDRGRALPSPGPLVTSFAAEGYVLSTTVARTLLLADALEKPILVEGPPGVGKTELARLWARHHGSPLVRLQCYEGIDESRAIYEWSYGKQVLYSQLLRDKVREVTGDAPTLDAAIHRLHEQTDAFFSEAFLLPRPLLRALTSDRPVVLLIDEIDRSDEEFEAFLLEILSEFQITIPELGTIRARHRPRVILTSNDTRDLADALRRRCLYLHLDYPTLEEELAILERRVPELDASLRERLAAFVARVRKAQLRKSPGIAETIDWAMALVAVGAEDLRRDEIEETLGALLKNRDDVDAVLKNLSSFKPV
jgi:MoxR-like ATPase